MTSKEEIEKMKKYLKECIIKEHIFEEDFTIEFMKNALQYIEQLETDKQKLIEKLEQDSSNGFAVEYKDNHKTILKQKVEPVRNYIRQELLPILKEESENEQSRRDAWKVRL